MHTIRMPYEKYAFIRMPMDLELDFPGMTIELENLG